MPPMAALRLEGEDEETLFFELVPQPRFALGCVYPFRDFAVGRREPAAKLHVQTPRVSVARPSSRPQNPVSKHIIVV